MRLFVDDIRQTPQGFDLRAYSYNEALEFLSTGKITYISLDHDLAEEKTGYDILLYIEERVHNGEMLMPEIEVHSANPVGRANILRGYESMKARYSK